METRRERQREWMRKWRAANREKNRENNAKAVRKYRAANPGRVIESGRKCRAANLESRRESARKWQKANPEKHREQVKKWDAANPEQLLARQAARRARKLAATVPLTKEEKARISALYAERRRRTQETGYPWEAHHIKALADGGLHHPDNMEVIPAVLNRAIGKKHLTGLEYLMS